MLCSNSGEIAELISGRHEEESNMCHQYAEHYLKWLSGLEEEIEYWKLYMEEKGGVSFYGFEETISSNKHFVLEDDIPAEYIGKEYHFLDVGSGPFSRCGRITDKVYLDACPFIFL